MDGDWRLQGQERYLTDAHLTWRPWTQTRSDWDHDHGEFCFSKFSVEAQDDDVLNAGWTTAGAERWICDPGAKDFRERFGLVLERTGADVERIAGAGDSENEAAERWARDDAFANEPHLSEFLRNFGRARIGPGCENGDHRNTNPQPER